MLEGFRNIHSGERAFILGTGPSLDSVPDWALSALASEQTFGVNTLLAYPRLPFTPTYYCVAESAWLQNISIPDVVEKLKKLPHWRFYAHHKSLYDERLRDWIYMHYESGADILQGDFQGLGETFPYVSNGRSVVSMAIQIACWMGFSEIYLLGVDATKYGHARGLGLGRADDYRDTQTPFVNCIARAEQIITQAGRKLINLTEGGDLTIPRMKLRDVL